MCCIKEPWLQIHCIAPQIFGGLLSPREQEIAIEIFEGRTIRHVATELCIAEGTVKRTTHNIYCKMGVASQVELVHEIYARIAILQQNATCVNK